MKQLVLGLVLGAGMMMIAQAAEEEKLREIAVTTTKDAPVTVPPEYGHLVSVISKSEVQYLYFEASDGTVRIVLMGAGSALQQARTSLQLLTSGVYVINRRESP